jgi:hypothetical protein
LPNVLVLPRLPVASTCSVDDNCKKGDCPLLTTPITEAGILADDWVPLAEKLGVAADTLSFQGWLLLMSNVLKLLIVYPLEYCVLANVSGELALLVIESAITG